MNSRTQHLQPKMSQEERTSSLMADYDQAAQKLMEAGECLKSMARLVEFHGDLKRGLEQGLPDYDLPQEEQAWLQDLQGDLANLANAAGHHFANEGLRHKSNLGEYDTLPF